MNGIFKEFVDFYPIEHPTSTRPKASVSSRSVNNISIVATGQSLGTCLGLRVRSDMTGSLPPFCYSGRHKLSLASG